MFKEHEKFWSFMALGFGVMLLAVLAYAVPIPEGSSNLRVIDAALGGLLLALGSAAQALFRIQEPGDKEVKITNTRREPVPTNPSDTASDDGELPEEQKL